MKKTDRPGQILVCALIGALSFVFLYGLDSLHVTFDWWILNGYVEEDIIQHYAGWMAFRNSPWSFPLGLTRNLGYPAGVAISFTDSLPLVSIVLKCFSGILPETFQFFGWYTLACFVLQGVAAGLLAGLFTRRPWEAGGISLLFCFSPILIERAFRHTALASQWLVLFALYFYFRAKRTGKIPWAFLLLDVLCVGIHPYFLPMVCGILGAWTVERFWQQQGIPWRAALFFLGNLLLAGITGWILGLFGNGVSGASSGFGYYSMNLNALVNPSSLGMEGWSAFLPALPQTGGNYDGFNYLGMGVLLFGGAAAAGKIWRLMRERRILGFCREYGGLLLFFLFCCLFAVSNRVTLGEKELFYIPLPELLERVCSVFRASGRMFYPVYEMLFLTAGLFAVRLPERLFARNARGQKAWAGGVALAVLAGIQLYDLSPAIAWKQASIDASHMEPGSYDPAFYESREWAQVLGAYDRVELLNYHHDYNLAAFLMKHQAQSNILPANRGDFAAAQERCETMIRELYQGELMEEETVYITNDPELASQLLWNLPDQMAAYDLGEYKAFGKKKEGLDVKEAVSAQGKGQFVTVAADSPDWLYLKGARENELVFPYTFILEQELSQATALCMGEERIEIKGMEIYSNDYIRDYIYVKCEEGIDLTAWRNGQAIGVE